MDRSGRHPSESWVPLARKGAAGAALTSLARANGLMLAAALLLLAGAGRPASAGQHVSPDSIAGKMQWFADARLGIFIHWGIYSVKGVDESWAFYNRKMPYSEYMRQIAGFTARRYDPAAWAGLIRRSGARYAVITTKHHDGVALWDTKAGEPLPLSLAARSPAGSIRLGDGSSPAGDLIGPFFRELRRQGIKAGAYFSLIDWSRPDYPGFCRDSTRYAPADDPARWQGFRDFYQAQIGEIAARFNPDLWWFDGDWEHSAEEWEAEKVRRLILDTTPSAIINGRLSGWGDYETPEQNIPVERPRYPWWELCLTIGDAWGWQPQDTLYKSTHDLIAVFADVIGHGGNLLLDVGPREDGTIPPAQVRTLEELGQWNAKHASAIFGTRTGLPSGHYFGPSTMSPDSTTLYLFLPHAAGGSIEVKGLINAIRSVEVLGPDLALKHRVVGKISWSRVPGLVFIDVPAEAADPWMTVVRVKLDGPVRLYRGEGGLY